MAPRRTTPTKSLLLVLLATGCASYSATTILAPEDKDAGGKDAGTETGGKAGTGGTSSNGGIAAAAGSSNVGGSTIGGTSSSGGLANAGDTSSQVTGGASTAGGIGNAGGTNPQATGGTATAGGNSTIGGSSSTGGVTATGGLPPSAGTSSTGGSATTGGKSSGGNSSTGGTKPTGGTSAIGGISGTGGTRSVGGTSATGGATSTGGTVATGGAVSTGGVSSSGGTSATGGANPTGGASSCTNLQTDANNCGTCGHSCQGGSCVQGQCQPAVVVTMDSTLGPQAFAVDGFSIYYVYLSYSSVFVQSVSKSSVLGSSTQVTYASYSSYTKVLNQLYWTSYPPFGSVYNTTPLDIHSCDIGNCAVPGTTWTNTTARIIPNYSSSTRYLSTADQACATGLCISWWKSDGTSVNSFSYYNPLSSGSTAQNVGAISFNDTVYWIERDYDSTGAFITASLLDVDDVSASKAQLAGKLGETLAIIDANDQSVLLRDTSTSDLYRVPVPLGFGSQASQSLGVTGQAATEDANRLYWIDSQGTLYSCTSSNCVSTTKVLANGQGQLVTRLIQDETSLYWGRTSPSEVMRLAK